MRDDNGIPSSNASVSSEDLALVYSIRDAATTFFYSNANVTTERTSLEDGTRQRAHSLVRRLTAQLIVGCSDVKCRNLYCLTGKRNTSSRPERPLTVASALSTALALLSQSPNDNLMCQHIEKEVLILQDDDMPQDHTSLTQCLSRTKAMRRLLAPAEHVEDSKGIGIALRLVRPVCQRLQDLKIPPYTPDGMHNSKFIDNAEAAERILFSIWLVHQHIVGVAQPPELSGMMHRYSDGNARSPADSAALSEAMGRLRQTICFDIIREVCEVTAHRMRLDLAMSKRDSLGSSFASIVTKGLRLNIDFDRGNRMAAVNYQILRQCLIMVFLHTWDGASVIQMSSSTRIALWLQRFFLAGSIALPGWFISSTLSHMDTITTADTWLRYDRQTSEHILSYREIHEPTVLRDCFIMINHLRMRRASATNSILDGLRHEFMSLSTSHDIARELRIERLLESFLVLRVRRSHVLEDAANQLHGLHQSELFRPLRVRLVELDGSAIAQDLGGVQIEFFNLVVEALMDEKNGMFTKKSNGLFYPRQGCLQSMALWQKVGILFGLALYNCIPLPVDLPEVFYRHLQSTWNDSPGPIDDAWPEESASFSAMETNNVAAWGLAFEFNFEANGLHLVLPAAACRAFARENLAIPVTAIRCVDEPTRSIAAESISWPGWRFEMHDKSAEEPDEFVTEDNKHDFIEAYKRMYTGRFVRPQMSALMNGFYKVIDRETARLPDMASVFAGTKHIDLGMLRSSTVWEGLLDDADHQGLADMFWKVLNTWPAERLQALIKFVTAIERIPSGAGFTWKISVTESDDPDTRLPTSSTCFSTLYLPKYSSAEILDEKLTKAVEMGEYGFFVG